MLDWKSLNISSAHICCIFRPAFGVRSTQTLVEMVIFSLFAAKKLKKKQEICSKFLQKTVFFKFAPERWLTVLFPKMFTIPLMYICVLWNRK